MTLITQNQQIFNIFHIKRQFSMYTHYLRYHFGFMAEGEQLLDYLQYFTNVPIPLPSVEQHERLQSLTLSRPI